MDRFRYLSECDFQATISKPYTVVDLHHTIGHVYEGTLSTMKCTGMDAEVIFQQHTSITANRSHITPISSTASSCPLPLVADQNSSELRTSLFKECSNQFGCKKPNECVRSGKDLNKLYKIIFLPFSSYYFLLKGRDIRKMELPPIFFNEMIRKLKQNIQ